jgi:propanol-preferring alcohol dehydrogenase
MKGLLFTGPEQVGLQAFPDPEPGPGQVVVDIKASSLCRSDMSLYHGSSVLDLKDEVSVIPGHEPCGVVSQTGPGVDPGMAKVGDRVAVYLAVGCGHCMHCTKGDYMHCPDWKCIGFDINGGHAEKLLIPAINCLKMPDALSFASGALSTDKVGTLYHAQKRLGVSGRDTVVIFGMGPMGLVGVVVAGSLEATVIAVDVVDDRLEIAKKVGARHTINGIKTDVVQAVRELTGGTGADIGIDCSGSDAAQNQMLDSLRVHGKGAFIGESRKATINPSDQLIRKQLTVMGSWYFPIWEYEEIAGFIMTKRIDLAKLITHEYRLEHGPEAFRLFDERETGIVIFTP